MTRSYADHEDLRWEPDLPDSPEGDADPGDEQPEAVDPKPF